MLFVHVSHKILPFSRKTVVEFPCCSIDFNKLIMKSININFKLNANI